MMILTSFLEKLPPGYIHNQFLCLGSLQVTGFTDENLECPAQNFKSYHFPRSKYYTHTALQNFTSHLCPQESNFTPFADKGSICLETLLFLGAACEFHADEA